MGIILRRRNDLLHELIDAGRQITQQLVEGGSIKLGLPEPPHLRQAHLEHPQCFLCRIGFQLFLLGVYVVFHRAEPVRDCSEAQVRAQLQILLAGFGAILCRVREEAYWTAMKFSANFSHIFPIIVNNCKIDCMIMND
uniref:Uncharacterized protein n=1 Tax=Anopheles albimanus TaxID=7167 RepID=A0A182FZ79_ANOAL